MTITFVGSISDEQENGTGSLTMTPPTHQADDFGLIMACGDDPTGILSLTLTVASGWTNLVDDWEENFRNRRTKIWYKKFTSSSETAPVITCDQNEDHSASLHVFRGVHTTDPFDRDTPFFTEDDGDGSVAGLNPTNAAIVTDNDNACVVLYHHHTQGEEFTGITAPSGYTLGEDARITISTGAGHGGHACAYLLDVGTAGTETPTAWQNTGTWVTADFSVHTIALRNDEPASGDPLMGAGIF
jgi:hypothetical protein